MILKIIIVINCIFAKFIIIIGVIIIKINYVIIVVNSLYFIAIIRIEDYFISFIVIIIFNEFIHNLFKYFFDYLLWAIHFFTMYLFKNYYY